jgi:hypothetical protein
MIMICVWLANSEQERGAIFHDKVLRGQINSMTAQINKLKAATQAASSASQPSNGP